MGTFPPPSPPKGQGPTLHPDSAPLLRQRCSGILRLQTPLACVLPSPGPSYLAWLQAVSLRALLSLQRSPNAQREAQPVLEAAPPP